MRRWVAPILGSILIAPLSFLRGRWPFQDAAVSQDEAAVGDWEACNVSAWHFEDGDEDYITNAKLLTPACASHLHVEVVHLILHALLAGPWVKAICQVLFGCLVALHKRVRPLFLRLAAPVISFCRRTTTRKFTKQVEVNEEQQDQEQLQQQQQEPCTPSSCQAANASGRPARPVAKLPPPPPPGKARPPPRPKSAATTPKNVTAPFDKRLHWRTFDAVGGTVFGELPEYEKPDERMLWSVFEPQKSSGAMTSRASTKMAPQSSGVCVLDPKRAHTLGIIFKRASVPITQLVESLAVNDFTIPLLEEDVVQLLKQWPTVQEQTSVTQATKIGGDAELRDVERIVLKVAAVPRSQMRLQLLLLAKGLEAFHATFVQSMEHLARAVQELRGSGMWRRLLAAALGIGNYINYGSAGGGVKGISIESLSQLHAFKGAGGVTALHCVCETLRSKDVCFCQKLMLELQSIPEAARVNVATLNESIDRLQTELASALREIKEHKSVYFTGMRACSRKLLPGQLPTGVSSYGMSMTHCRSQYRSGASSGETGNTCPTSMSRNTCPISACAGFSDGSSSRGPSASVETSTRAGSPSTSMSSSSETLPSLRLGSGRTGKQRRSTSRPNVEAKKYWASGRPGLHTSGPQNLNLNTRSFFTSLPYRGVALASVPEPLSSERESGRACSSGACTFRGQAASATAQAVVAAAAAVTQALPAASSASIQQKADGESGQHAATTATPGEDDWKPTLSSPTPSVPRLDLSVLNGSVAAPPRMPRLHLGAASAGRSVAQAGMGGHSTEVGAPPASWPRAHNLGRRPGPLSPRDLVEVAKALELPPGALPERRCSRSGASSSASSSAPSRQSSESCTTSASSSVSSECSSPRFRVCPLSSGSLWQHQPQSARRASSQDGASEPATPLPTWRSIGERSMGRRPSCRSSVTPRSRRGSIVGFIEPHEQGVATPVSTSRRPSQVNFALPSPADLHAAAGVPQRWPNEAAFLAVGNQSPADFLPPHFGMRDVCHEQMAVQGATVTAEGPSICPPPLHPAEGRLSNSSKPLSALRRRRCGSSQERTSNGTPQGGRSGRRSRRQSKVFDRKDFGLESFGSWGGDRMPAHSTTTTTVCIGDAIAADKISCAEEQDALAPMDKKAIQGDADEDVKERMASSRCCAGGVVHNETKHDQILAYNVHNRTDCDVCAEDDPDARLEHLVITATLLLGDAKVELKRALDDIKQLELYFVGLNKGADAASSQTDTKGQPGGATGSQLFGTMAQFLTVFKAAWEDLRKNEQRWARYFDPSNATTATPRVTPRATPRAGATTPSALATPRAFTTPRGAAVTSRTASAREQRVAGVQVR